jgi:hypothetical protein
MALEEIEEMWAYKFSEIMSKADPDDEFIESIPPEIISAGKRLLGKYTNGRLIDFIRFLEVKSEFPYGASRLLERLFQ